MMIGRRVAVGLTLLCALVISAFMASSASAVVAGTTGFTCQPEPAPTKTTKGFTDEHCNTKEIEGTSVKFIHAPIAQDKTTIIHGTNEKTSSDTLKSESAILKTTVAIVGKVQITCEKVFAHGNQTNRLNAGTGEHFIHGEKVTILYTGCKFVEPSTCKVQGGKIEVTGVTATTEKEEMNVRFKPEVGKTFVVIKTENCLGVTEMPVEGSVRGQVSGATLTFSEAGTTADKSLTVLGAAAGLEGKVTIRQADETQEAGKTGNPLTATTIET